MPVYASNERNAGSRLITYFQSVFEQQWIFKASFYHPGDILPAALTVSCCTGTTVEPSDAK